MQLQFSLPAFASKLKFCKHVHCIASKKQTLILMNISAFTLPVPRYSDCMHVCVDIQDCSTTCCNASTCMLTVNSTCATGTCCDLDTCQVGNNKIIFWIKKQNSTVISFSKFCASDWRMAIMEWIRLNVRFQPLKVISLTASWFGGVCGCRCGELILKLSFLDRTINTRDLIHDNCDNLNYILAAGATY